MGVVNRPVVAGWLNTGAQQVQEGQERGSWVIFFHSLVFFTRNITAGKSYSQRATWGKGVTDVGYPKFVSNLSLEKL